MDLTAADYEDDVAAIQALYESVDDVAVVSVHDGGVGPEAAAAYAKELGVRFPVGCDLEIKSKLLNK